MEKHFSFLSAEVLLWSIVLLFSLHASPACAQMPGVVNIQADDIVITVRFPNGWSPARFGNLTILFNVPPDQQQIMSADDLAKVARIMILTEDRDDHADAVQRLADIAASTDAPVTFLNIWGWPALQRRFLTTKPRPGQQGQEELEDFEPITDVTTAIAAGHLLVKLDCGVPTDMPPQILEQVIAIGQQVTFSVSGNPVQTQKEIQDLTKSSPVEVLPPPPPRVVPRPVDPPGVAVSHQVNNNSEVEIAASSNGRNIVIGTNIGFHFSNDGGLTWHDSTGLSSISDPSVALGRSGAFYAANILVPPKPPKGPRPPPFTVIDISTDNGATFSFRAKAFTCGTKSPNVCGYGIPDQEHIAADHVNPAPAGGDQVYSAWRHDNSGKGTYGIVCSQDNGVNWSSAPNFTSGDLPRITVGQDGFVYVVYRDNQNIMLNKYNQCKDNQSPMKPVKGFPVTVVKNIKDVACPVPGLDRCNDGNALSSHMVAVDDSFSKHIYVAYAVNTFFRGTIFEQSIETNDNVEIIDSMDGGKTWRSAKTVNTAVTGRRFMPWVCTVNGTAYVSWYDRRFATAAENDLTDYFGGSAYLAGSDAALTIGPEFRISEVSDSQCNDRWGNPPRSPMDSALCSVQPQLAGLCRSCSGSGCITGTTRCDYADCGTCVKANPSKPSTWFCKDNSGTFKSCSSDDDCTRSSECTCSASETCITGGGDPKYGDYNGNACAYQPGFFPGKLLTAWASQIAPADLGPFADIDLFFSIYPQADLGTTVSCPPALKVNQELKCLVTVTNGGPNDAFDIKLNFTIPAGADFESWKGPWGLCRTFGSMRGPAKGFCGLDDLANGESTSATLIFRPIRSGIFQTTATAKGSLPDLDQSNNEATGSTTVAACRPGDPSCCSPDMPQCFIDFRP